jgi:hypothetical protein
LEEIGLSDEGRKKFKYFYFYLGARWTPRKRKERFFLRDV